MDDLNFFHESFFDHVYARAFLNKDTSLIDFLAETEQHLFRRTQVRQILEALRQADRGRYLKELSSVLLSEKIRFHIKAAICQWLNTIDLPHEAEFKIISKFDKTGNTFHSFFRSAVLSTEAWFDLLNKNSWIKQELEGDNVERTEAVLWWFSNIAGERPAELASLLRSWWGHNDERANRLLSWFGYIRRAKPDHVLLQLCKDLINAHPENLFEEKGRDRIMMLLYSWTEKSPEQCGQVLHSLFDAWFSLYPLRNPLARDEGKIFDTHSLTELEKKSPSAFLQGTTDALTYSIDMVLTEGKRGRHWYDFNRMIHSKHLFGFEGFLTIYRSALNKVAKENPEDALTHLNKLDPHKHKSLMHLYLGAIQANSIKLGHLLPSLVTNKLVFEAGWDGADWTSFAHACRATFPHLKAEEKTLIEKIILDHSPELDDVIRFLQKNNQENETELCQKKERVIRRLNYSGYQQWCILESIGEDLLCPDSRSRLTELHRKFPKKKVEKPIYTEMREVGSPIKQAQCERMKDHHWLSAIKRYDDEKERHRSYDSVVGGARDLAAQLREVTKKDPDRFAKLSLKIPDTAHHSYMEHILWGLEESEAPSDELLIRVVLHAYQHSEKPFSNRITWLIEKHPHIAADPEILGILIWYALNGKADENQVSEEQNTERKTIDIDTLLEWGSHLQIRGINGERGQAWETLEAILWRVPEAEQQVWETINIALERETLISVRCCMMKSLLPLFNMDKKRFSDSILKLIILPEGTPKQLNSSQLSPLITHAGIQLFPYIFNCLPELGNELAEELLESRDETKELVGAWLIFCASFSHGTHIEKADDLASVSVNHRRLLADVASQVITWAENRHRAERLLKEFFFDEDEQVRQKASDVFRHIKADEVERYRELTAIFLNSPAFMENSSSLMHMLESASGDVLELIVDVAQQLIKNIGERGDQRGPHAADTHYLQDLLKREYTASESKPEARKKILDLIDLMLLNEIYGVESIVTAHERW